MYNEHVIKEGSTFDIEVMKLLNNVLSSIKTDTCFWVEAWYLHGSEKADEYRLTVCPDLVNMPWKINYVGYSDVFSSSEIDVLRVKEVRLGACKRKLIYGNAVAQMPQLIVESLRHPGYVFDLLRLVAEEHQAFHGPAYDAYYVQPFVSYTIKGASLKENIRYKVDKPCVADKIDILSFADLLAEEKNKEKQREKQRQEAILRAQKDKYIQSATLINLSLDDIWAKLD